MPADRQLSLRPPSPLNQAIKRLLPATCSCNPLLYTIERTRDIHKSASGNFCSRDRHRTNDDSAMDYTFNPASGRLYARLSLDPSNHVRYGFRRILDNLPWVP